jgi:hypothetical protein
MSRTDLGELHYVHPRNQISGTPPHSTRRGLPLRFGPSTAHLRAALVAAQARECRADLRHHDGALVVHPVTRLDAAHAAEAVGDTTAAPTRLLEYLQRLRWFLVAEACEQIFPGCCFVTKS